MRPSSMKMKCQLKGLCAHREQSMWKSPAQLLMSKPCKTFEGSSTGSQGNAFAMTSGPLGIITEQKYPDLKPFKSATCCYGSAQIRFYCTTLWVLPPAAEAVFYSHRG